MGWGKEINAVSSWPFLSQNPKTEFKIENVVVKMLQYHKDLSFFWPFKMHFAVDKNDKSSFVNKAYILLEMLANNFLPFVQNDRIISFDYSIY